MGILKKIPERVVYALRAQFRHGKSTAVILHVQFILLILVFRSPNNQVGHTTIVSQLTKHILCKGIKSVIVVADKQDAVGTELQL